MTTTRRGSSGTSATGITAPVADGITALLLALPTGSSAPDATPSSRPTATRMAANAPTLRHLSTDNAAAFQSSQRLDILTLGAGLLLHGRDAHQAGGGLAIALGAGHRHGPRSDDALQAHGPVHDHASAHLGLLGA